MPIGINKVDGTMHVLFHKNQPLPDYKTRTLTTSKANQRSIMLRLYQGESSLVAENELLGTFVFGGIRPAPKGKVQIEVTFHIDSEGILNLTARDKATGQTVESTLKLGKKRKRDEDTKKKAAAPAAAPAPLNMPTSALAREIAGDDLQELSDDDVTGGNSDKNSDAKSDGNAKAEKDDDGKSKVMSANTASTEPDGVLARVSGWFKKLFGG
jgi:molecular chaperone DnaK